MDYDCCAAGLIGHAVGRARRSCVNGLESDDLNAEQRLKGNIHSGIPQGGRGSEVHIGFDCDNNAADVLADQGEMDKGFACAPPETAN